MCAIFGFVNYRHAISGRHMKELVNRLAVESEVRGTDATGIAYVKNDELKVYKRPKPAHKMRFYFPEDTTILTGHTRMTTQGNAKYNYNNHPFEGTTSNHTFALAHNGVLYNDKELRKEKELPETNIETDSYIAVQLIEHENSVDSNSIKAMAEALQGSFVFTILRDDNTLFLVKGDNPITLIHFPEYGLYVYASTTAILNAAMKAVKFSGVCNEVKVNDGDIVRIDSDGKLSVSTFEAQVQHFDWHYLYRLYGYDYGDMGEDYTNDLLMICGCYGVDREDVELLFEFGYSSDEVEEMLMDHDLLEQAIEEIKTLYQR